MSAVPKLYLTPTEYLAFERQSDIKHEYFRGDLFAMAGASRQHAQIAPNLAYLFVGQLKGRPCDVFNSDMRVKVSPTGLYTYPDLAIVCGRPRFEDKELDTLLNPTVIIEILSKSTEAYDRGEKFVQYRTLETLTDYLLISQARPHIERFTRQEGGLWLLSESIGLDAVMPIESIQCQLPLAEVYDRVEFEEASSTPKLSLVKEEVEAYAP
ncbi:MAG TPA: Uma2 family endonuclease [Anaerolineae bacterium]|nr:Uma2 family endonuclease [Anaerolineae bacterium]HNU03366.1 Uma2 family endonuclease [Anaerolineae bacterium]